MCIYQKSRGRRLRWSWCVSWRSKRWHERLKRPGDSKVNWRFILFLISNTLAKPAHRFLWTYSDHGGWRAAETQGADEDSETAGFLMTCSLCLWHFRSVFTFVFLPRRSSFFLIPLFHRRSSGESSRCVWRRNSVLGRFWRYLDVQSKRLYTVQGK